MAAGGTAMVDGPVVVPSAAGRDVAVTLVTVIMVVVVGLTFAFGFGNVFQLGLRLGVPIWVAPLVAPAVDLSVVGLLLGTRQLAVQGAPPELLHPARRLLVFSSVVTLALNVAEPVIAGDYGKAAFDAVGPALLIGWSEVGPGLLRAMRHPTTFHPVAQDATISESASRPETGGAAVFTAVSAPSGGESPRAEVVAVPGQRAPERPSAVVLDGSLLERARREDARYWEEHRRPISSDELRKRLKVGSKRARALVTQLRTEAHRVLEEHAPTADLPEVGTAALASDADDGAADGLLAAVGPDDDMVDLGPVEPAGPGVLAAVG
ncbi:hypothetical protein FF36_04513 [Frankia torreyi]|uniref:DUF2637 domain-containing protein n=1 Tax=Frankia torreyi TaxID=1856 RepID=A0A0D8BA61_9ACTN|nr:hypothetical protein [Frankia torreyi]KJE21173.1 hypothetical protein FF36_04513 [Frankia torreyi]